MNRFCALALDRSLFIYPSTSTTVPTILNVSDIYTSYPLHISFKERRHQALTLKPGWPKSPDARVGFPHSCAWCGFRCMRKEVRPWQLDVRKYIALMPFLRVFGLKKLIHVALQAPLVSKLVAFMARMRCIKECYDHSLWIGTSGSAGIGWKCWNLESGRLKIPL